MKAQLLFWLIWCAFSISVALPAAITSDSSHYSSLGSPINLDGLSIREQLEQLLKDENTFHANIARVTANIRQHMLAGVLSRQIASGDMKAADHLAKMGEIGKFVLTYHLRRTKRYGYWIQHWRLQWRLMWRSRSVWRSLPQSGRRVRLKYSHDLENQFLDAIRRGANLDVIDNFLKEGADLHRQYSREFASLDENNYWKLKGDVFFRLIQIGCWPETTNHQFLKSWLARNNEDSVLVFLLGNSSISNLNGTQAANELWDKVPTGYLGGENDDKLISYLFRLSITGNRQLLQQFILFSHNPAFISTFQADYRVLNNIRRDRFETFQRLVDGFRHRLSPDIIKEAVAAVKSGDPQSFRYMEYLWPLVQEDHLLKKMLEDGFKAWSKEPHGPL